MKENRYNLLITLGFFLVMIMRQLSRIVHPTLWAEDGAVFLNRSLHEGIYSIIHSYDGYLQVLPQIISLLCYQIIGLKYYSLANLAVSTYIYSYAFSLITRNSYSWINSNLLIRYLIAINLTLLPGTTEILGNLANLHTILIILICLRCLAADREEIFTLFDLIMFFFTAFSAGEFFILIPICYYRYLSVKSIKINKHLKWQYYYVFSLFVISFITNFIILQSKVNSKFHINFIEYCYSLLKHSPAIVTTIINRLIFFPILGNISNIINSSYIVVICSLIIMFIFTKKKSYKLLFNILHTNKLLTITIASQILLIFLIMYVRPFNIGAPYLGRISTINDSLSSKYLIMLTPFATIYWYTFFTKITNNSINLLALFFSISLFTNHNRIIFPDFYNTVAVQNIHANYWYSSYNNLYKGTDISIAPDAHWVITHLSNPIVTTNNQHNK